MRVIKFRAWDKQLKKMLPVEGINFRDKKASYSEGHSFYQYFDEVELMQYTGLKDKNGKEIYEGDILEHWEERYIVPPFTPLDRSYQGENVKENYDGSDDWISMSNVDWEVVGNIYENKDLITRS